MSLWLADTNVLLRAIQRDDLHTRTLARTALKTIHRRGDSVCVLPQNLMELWAVATRPLDVNGLGLSVQHAARAVSVCESFFAVLPETAAIFPEWRRLVLAYQVVGLKAHDTHLVAAMVVHSVKRILTFDAHDFSRYREIEAVQPIQLAGGP